MMKEPMRNVCIPQIQRTWKHQQRLHNSDIAHIDDKMNINGIRKRGTGNGELRTYHNANG